MFVARIIAVDPKNSRACNQLPGCVTCIDFLAGAWKKYFQGAASANQEKDRAALSDRENFLSSKISCRNFYCRSGACGIFLAALTMCCGRDVGLIRLRVARDRNFF